MFLNELIRRKVASLLQPWLRPDPELQLKLGFLRSQGIANNLSFNTGALNELLPDSTRLYLANVTIERLSLQLSNWSSPALAVELHGVRITLSAEEVEEKGNVRRNQKPVDTEMEDMKKVLSELDPQGSSLHAALEMMLSTNYSSDWKTFLLNTILSHARVQIHDVHVLVQFPFSDISSICLLEIKELTAEPNLKEPGSLLGGFTSFLLLPSRESSFHLKAKGFQICLEGKDQICQIIRPTDFLMCFMLRNLQLISFNLQVPELKISFSPINLPFILASNALLLKEDKSVKIGRQLWKIAAGRISSFVSSPKLSLQRVVKVVCLWLRYVHAYEELLLLIGYPMKDMMERFDITMCRDKKFLSSVNRQWKLISEIEKELPAEAIAQARRIVRHRAASNVKQAKDSWDGSVVNGWFILLQLILRLIALIWNVFCSMFNTIINFVILQNFFAYYQKITGCKAVPEDPCLQHCFSLNVGRILFTICADSPSESPGTRKSTMDIGISSLDFLSFCLLFDVIVLKYKKTVCEQCFSFSCGRLKLMSLPFGEDQFKNCSSVLEGRWAKELPASRTILWSEPAKLFHPAETTRNGSQRKFVSYLESILAEMWLNWKRSFAKLQPSDIYHLENPAIVLESKVILIDQVFKSPSSGSWKCCLVVGKLNFILGYSSILSMTVLFEQVQHALSWTDSRTGKIILHTPTSFEDRSVVDQDNKYKLYADTTELAIRRMLPEKQIYFGAFFAGPHIQLLMRKEGFLGGNTDVNRAQADVHLTFDVNDIELAVSPALKSYIGSSVMPTTIETADIEWPKLKEPEIIDFPSLDSENYTCEGRISHVAYLKLKSLNAYFERLREIQTSQIIVMSQTTIHLSLTREETRSFGSTIVAFSAAFFGVIPVLKILVFMDELSTLLEVIFGLSNSVLCTYTKAKSVDSLNSDEIPGQKLIPDDSERKWRSAPGAKRTSLITMRVLSVFNCISELRSIDIVLHNSRERKHVDNSKMIFDAGNGNKMAMHNLPDYGICVSCQQLGLEVFFNEGMLEVLSVCSGIQSLIFKPDTTTSFDLSDSSNLSTHSPDCLYEMAISHFSSSLLLRSARPHLFCGSEYDRIDASTSSNPILHTVGNSSVNIDIEGSRLSSLRFCQNFSSAAKITNATSSNSLLVNFSVSEIYLARSLVKEILLGTHQFSRLQSSLCVAGECQTISCRAQGGSVFLDTSALPMFVQCLASYYFCFRLIFPIGLSSEVESVAASAKDKASLSDHPGEESKIMSQLVKWEQLEVLTLDLSQFSLVLFSEDEVGQLQELLFDVNVRIDFEVAYSRRKISFGLSHLSILSSILDETVNQHDNRIQIPNFFNEFSSDVSSNCRDLNIASHSDGKQSVLEEASCSNRPGLQKDSYGDMPNYFHLGLQNYILKQSSAFLAVEKFLPRGRVSSVHLNQAWVGNGSVSGLDITISVREIQMILSFIESFSGVFSKKSTIKVEETRWSIGEESSRSLECKPPDGSIIAIQDVYQHMYITVEDADNGYNLVGAIHYSLVGERALFRVTYHSQKIWRSSILWFSLTSLHAKSDSGKPLRLNCRPGSGFVEVSSTNDSGWALWRTHPYKLERYEGDADLDSYNPVAKHMFSLVNKKTDSAIAFIDGALEVVSKPGSPFKWKVFHDLPPVRGILLVNNHLMETSGSNMPHNSKDNQERTLDFTGNHSCINVTIERITLTVVHELSDSKERLALLQGSVSPTEFIVQIPNDKARVICRSVIVLYCFDALRNIWKEFVHPLEICILYSSRFQLQGSERVLPHVPVHFYARTERLEISVTELALDILLLVIGKLSLAGPYAIKSYLVLANCCKVENQSDLALLCHLSDRQDALIARKQSHTIFLRNLALASEPPESSIISVQLTDQGAYMTSPIHISVSEARAFAWRTRIVSLQDSKTYPGPFVVIESSQKNEDGLSVVVSPLFRMHNETDFSMELRFQRPHKEEAEIASLLLKSGDSIDDSVAAFGAINFSGGLKKALMSLSVGNFLCSFRPTITDESRDFMKPIEVEWSDVLEGGKAVRLSGLLDKLSYEVRKAFSVDSFKFSFNTAHCSLKSEDRHIDRLHFLIQSIRRDVPIVHPNNPSYAPGNRRSPIALQEQKEIFLLPTVRVTNLLQSDIHVLLTDTDPSASVSCENIGKQATITCGSTVNLYANPATIYFVVTLIAFSSCCKAVNSGEWVKKFKNRKYGMNRLDIELEFGGGKYFAFLALSRGERGILEAAVYTPYILQNDTNLSLICYASNMKPLSRDEVQKLGSAVPPELGYFLPPNSVRSWFIRCNKMHLKLLEENDSEVLLDLDALSGLSEIDLEVEEGSGYRYVTKLGVSLRPSTSNAAVPSQIVSMNPRYVVSNESEEFITIRQCFFEDDRGGMIVVSNGQKVSLKLRTGLIKKKEVGVFENLIRKHRNAQDDSSLLIQFRPNDAGFGWSGPVCVASLGRFFLRFRRSFDSNYLTAKNHNLWDFAAIHVVEEGAAIVLHFHRPPNTDLPYRIENCLRDASISYYQKGCSEPEVLGSGDSVSYVWDDITLPRKLMVHINGVQLLREINLDKVRAWKPFYRMRQHSGLGSHLALIKRPGDQKRTSSVPLSHVEIVNLGYEIYADGGTRVLRICEISDRLRGNKTSQFSAKMQLRISNFGIHLLELRKEVTHTSEMSAYTPFLVMKLGSINMDSVFTAGHKFVELTVQSLSVEEKWAGAPFAAMLRRHQSEYGDTNDSVLRVVLVLLSSNSNVRQVKLLSLVLQPLDLNIDEETLMKIVPFWRTSLSDPNTPSQLYYFEHFEIHPIKITSTFLPGDSYSSYSSTQETLRSLLHSVIKVPTIKNMTVELNGVLVTHVLITIRELSIKCVQHYSWYAMRAIYIAKGSPLLPPAFTSVFDDLASSSLDVFFDPSSGLINLPGLTLGTFKLISKCIDAKGFTGTKRYFGDLGKTLKTAGSNVLFAAVTEISDSILKGAETSGFDGMISGFHQGIMKLAMEPSFLGSAFMEGGPDRKIKLDRSPGVDELYVEGYLQAMLDSIYKQEYLRVRVIEDQVVLKNLPPNSSLIDEIVDRVKDFLESKSLLKGESSTSRPLRHIHGESEWKIGPTVLTLCEHIFVSFAIRLLKKQASKITANVGKNDKLEAPDQKAVVIASTPKEQKVKFIWKWGIGKFVLSAVVAYIDGRLCRNIPNPLARRIVSGFLLSFLDKNDNE